MSVHAFVDGLTYPAVVDRPLWSTGMARGASGIGHRSGVLGVADLAVTSAGGLTIHISPGTAMIAPDYALVSTSTVTLALDAGGATPRIDLVVARVRDTGDGAPQGGAVEVVKGTPAASPQPPPVPARSLALSRVTVAANASSITSSSVTDLRAWTSTQGPVRAPGGLLRSPVANGIAEGTDVYDPIIRAVATATSAGWLYHGVPEFSSVAQRDQYYNVSGSGFPLCITAKMLHVRAGATWTLVVEQPKVTAVYSPAPNIAVTGATRMSHGIVALSVKTEIKKAITLGAWGTASLFAVDSPARPRRVVAIPFPFQPTCAIEVNPNGTVKIVASDAITIAPGVFHLSGAWPLD